MLATIIVITVFLDGVLAGVFVGSALVEHAAARLDAAAWVPYKQAKEAVFGPVMPVFFGIALLMTGFAAVVSRGAVGLVAGAALLAVVLIVTVRIHLPLNVRIQQWQPDDTPDEWDAVRRRWRRWNLLRTILAVAAYAAVLSAWR